MRIPVFTSRTSPSSARSRPSRRAIAALLPVIVLTGCGETSRFAPPCPQTAILSDAADLVRYRVPGGGTASSGRDITDMVLDGRITGISGKCSAGDQGERVSMGVTLDLNRGPAASGRAVDLTYFVAVARGQDILDKQVFPLHVEFPANTDVVHVTTGQIVMNLPTTRAMSGAAFTVLTGFQLTPQELAANRSRRGQPGLQNSP